MIEFSRVLSDGQQSPFDTITWEVGDIKIHNNQGELIYECKGAEFPASWSPMARQITASKYFRESYNSAEKEHSLRQTISRVVSAIKHQGIKQGYLGTDENANIFEDELTMILLHQMAAFNSPVWFNLGVPGVKDPQCSACFINEVEDDMNSILNLAVTEGRIFKDGSGSGVNLSTLRASTERINGGGFASGPVSFMQGYDAFANIIMSGGRTRRSARMVILNIDHPDILKFIQCKSNEEDLVALLVAQGLSTDFNDTENAYNHVKHQSGNNSVRVTDEFMSKVREAIYYGQDSTWNLVNRTDDKIATQLSTRKLFKTIAQAAHKCGDPGIQFHDTINEMNTCPRDGDIHASNPCSEFMWLNNSACNLASINLHRFATSLQKFDIPKFKHVVRTVIVAQDILINAAGYPTQQIKENSHRYRPLGLGFANLGGLLMGWGLPYDSDEGRLLASGITSLMTAQAYYTSMELAQSQGPFIRYSDNKTHMETVLERHYAKTKQLVSTKNYISTIITAATSIWKEVVGTKQNRKKSVDREAGFRNCQVTLLAPTGTISFLMDCATSGIEPDIGLRKVKKLIGGNDIVLENPMVKSALQSLEYDDANIEDLLRYVKEHGHFENSKLKEEHLPVFDCALPIGSRQISTNGHIKMVAAIQPFLSGAISKTFNMPNKSTVADVERILLQAWESKLKCITIYREGSKMSEPLRVREVQTNVIKQNIPKRKKLPDDLFSPPTRPSRHKFSIGGHTGYIHPGYDENGNLVEIFLRMAKSGSTIGGLVDNYFILFSKALQFGVPLEELLSNMEGSKFDPAGPTANRDIHLVSSILDYVAKWTRHTYLDNKTSETTNTIGKSGLLPPLDINANICPNCGELLRRVGTCSICVNCSYNTGVCG